MKLEDTDELHGRVEAIQIVLREILAGIDRDSPVRRAIVDKLGEAEKDLAQLLPGSDRLYGFKEARADIGLGRLFMNRPPRGER